MYPIFQMGKLRLEELRQMAELSFKPAIWDQSPCSAPHDALRPSLPTCELPEPLQTNPDLPQGLLCCVEGDRTGACLLDVYLQVVLQVLTNS